MNAPQITPEQYADIAARIETEVGKVIVGQTFVVRTVLLALLCEGHVLLEGVPWLGEDQAADHAGRRCLSRFRSNPVHP